MNAEPGLENKHREGGGGRDASRQIGKSEKRANRITRLADFMYVPCCEFLDNPSYARRVSRIDDYTTWGVPANALTPYGLHLGLSA